MKVGSLESVGRSKSSVWLGEVLNPCCLINVGKRLKAFWKNTSVVIPSIYVGSHLCLKMIYLHHFLDFPESFVPLPQNPQRVKPDLEQPNVSIMLLHIYLPKTWSRVWEQVCPTYGFCELVLEELDIGEEDRRGYLEDCHPIWFK